MRGTLALSIALVSIAIPSIAIPSIAVPSRAEAQDDAGGETVGGGAALGAPAPVASDGDEASLLGLEEDALPRAALLDHRFGEARDGRSERLHAWASFAFFGGAIAPAEPIQSLATRLDSGDAIVISPSIGARLALTRELDASFEWNAAYGATHVRGELDVDGRAEPFEGDREVFAGGNPVMQITFTHDWSILSLQVGVGAALPVAALAQAGFDAPSATDRAASVLVHELMLAMDGALDPWRFLPERLSFLVPVRIAIGDRLGGAVEVAGGWTIPVLGSQTGSQHEGVLQVAGDLAYDILPELRAGVRGSVVAWRIGRPDGPVRTQGAIEPWVRTTFGPIFATVRATLDVGGDYGLGTSAGVWAIHVGGGGSLE